MELKSTLGSIIGARGVRSSYVLIEDDNPQDNPGFTWDKRFMYLVVLEGTDYRIEKRTIHQIILSNVAEDSDANTYIEPRINKEDGSIDIKTLTTCYNNQATQQEWINAVYKNERVI